jgi:hypothetical protein
MSELPEIRPETAEEARRAGEAFNAGAPTPVVDAAELKRAWRFVRKHRESSEYGEGKANGWIAFANPGYPTSNPSGENHTAMMLRYSLLNALLERGVLREFVKDEELADAVFQAAATMPMDREDLAEAMILQRILDLPAEQAAQWRASLQSEGADLSHPKIDDKFLAAVREAQQR